MATYSTVPCEEVFNTVKESYSVTGRSVSVDLRCLWANRGALMQDLLGTPRSYPDDATLLCTSVASRPEPTKYTADEQKIIYEHAIVSVTYAIPGDTKEGDQQPDDPVKKISESFEPYTRVLTLDFDNFVWVSDDKPLIAGEEPGKVMHGIRMTRTYFELATINPDILDLPGTVHNASYSSAILGQTFAAGTLLMIAPVISRTILITGGTPGWTLKLAWDYNPNEWNKVWRQSSQTWDSVKMKDGGALYNSYEEVSHSNWLF